MDKLEGDYQFWAKHIIIHYPICPSQQTHDEGIIIPFSQIKKNSLEKLNNTTKLLAKLEYKFRK